MKSALRVLCLLGFVFVTGVACAGASEPPPAGEAPEEPAVEEPRPLPTEAANIESTAPAIEPLPTPSPEVAATAVPAIGQVPESRLLAFEWPRGIRVGDSDVIRLTLTLDESGNLTPTVVFEGHDITSQNVEVENLYDTHIIRAEARLDMAGVEVTPDGVVMQRMLPGEDVIFSWSLKPPERGTYRGNIWLFVRYIPMDGEGDELEKLLFNQVVEVEGLNLLGLGGQPARILGMIGVLVSSILGLDDIFGLLRRVLRMLTK